jgi:hypothetical protein
VGDLHRFTVDDYHRMAEAGILHEDSRVELIRGRIVDMAAIGSAHMVAVNRLTRLLVAAVGDRGVVSVQNPVRLDGMSNRSPTWPCSGLERTTSARRFRAPPRCCW